MNKLEFTIHKLLEGSPKIRNSIRTCYQTLLYCFPHNNRSKYRTTVRKGYFYGFHTVSPWSKNNKFLLSHRILNQKKDKLYPDSKISVGTFYGDDFTKYMEVTTTGAFNWQQGSMAQWVGDSEEIILNDIIGGTVSTRIVNMNGSDEFIHPAPVSAVSPNGKKYTSYSYYRLGKGMPGYGYDQLQCDSRSESLVEVDIASSVTRELVRIDELIKGEDKRSYFKSRNFHFFSHCLYSPSGLNLAFFHRIRGQSTDLITRLYVLNFENNNLVKLPIGNFVSHFSWISDNEILTYSENLLGERAYFIVYLSSLIVQKLELSGIPVILGDGHPQACSKRKAFLSDTYPDRYRVQRLFIASLEDGSALELAAFKIPLRFKNNFRCDFHPRWDRKCESISFDSAHPGERSHCTMHLKGGLYEKE